MEVEFCGEGCEGLNLFLGWGFVHCWLCWYIDVDVDIDVVMGDGWIRGLNRAPLRGIWIRCWLPNASKQATVAGILIVKYVVEVSGNTRLFISSFWGLF